MFVRTCLCVVVVLCVVAGYKIVDNIPIKFYPRSAWGALEPTSTRPLETPVPYVVIHHTYIPEACYNFEDCSKAMRSMQKYHMGLDWGDIGYNFCVGADGAVYEGRGWKNVGIHAGRANNYSIGICLIGDWRAKLPQPVTLHATKILITKGVNKGVISADYNLIGHGQVMSTECPGTALQDNISTWEHYEPGHIDFKKKEL